MSRRKAGRPSADYRDFQSSNPAVFIYESAEVIFYAEISEKSFN